VKTPDNWRQARATLAIAGLTFAAWALVAMLGLDRWAQVWGGFIPQRVAGVSGDEGLAPVLLTPLTSTLVHGGLIHIAFNLLMLVFCGRAVEAILGLRGLILLYLVSAYAAAGATLLAASDTLSVTIGASGAISGVFGAYALLFGRNRVKVANAALARALHVLWVGAAWIGLQLMIGFVTSGSAQPVAIAAHIGGFFAGLALATPLLLLRYRKA